MSDLYPEENRVLQSAGPNFSERLTSLAKSGMDYTPWGVTTVGQLVDLVMKNDADVASVKALKNLYASHDSKFNEKFNDPNPNDPKKLKEFLAAIIRIDVAEGRITHPNILDVQSRIAARYAESRALGDSILLERRICEHANDHESGRYLPDLGKYLPGKGRNAPRTNDVLNGLSEKEHDTLISKFRKTYGEQIEKAERYFDGDAQGSFPGRPDMFFGKKADSEGFRQAILAAEAVLKRHEGLFGDDFRDALDKEIDTRIQEAQKKLTSGDKAAGDRLSQKAKDDAAAQANAKQAADAAKKAADGIRIANSGINLADPAQRTLLNHAMILMGNEPLTVKEGQTPTDSMLRQQAIAVLDAYPEAVKMAGGKLLPVLNAMEQVYLLHGAPEKKEGVLRDTGPYKKEIKSELEKQLKLQAPTSPVPVKKAELSGDTSSVVVGATVMGVYAVAEVNDPAQLIVPTQVRQQPDPSKTQIG